MNKEKSKVKRIVCLANSVRPGGYCVAGVELDNNDRPLGGDGLPLQWIRPVSSLHEHAISFAEQQYKDGEQPAVLDIMEIPLKKRAPSDDQQENWLIATNEKWRRTGLFEWASLVDLARRENTLWEGKIDSTNGTKDKIHPSRVTQKDGSLKLIYIDKLTLVRQQEHNKNSQRAEFIFGGEEYKLKVLDPMAWHNYPEKTTIKNACLTISLPDAYRGWRYQIVAAVNRPVIFTVGHSAHEFADFAALLRRHGVEAIADVRSAPYSRLHPQFSREKLAAALRSINIKYVFLGKELGARSADPDCYDDGRARFDKLAATEEFRAGIRRLADGGRRMKIALMCAEKDPLDCHRTILVAPALINAGLEVRHILADGGLETHAAAMKRLASRHKVQDWFRPSEEELYRLQEERIAYRVKGADTKEAGA